MCFWQLAFFSDKQGIASGILLMCFGFGSSIIGGLTVFLNGFLDLKVVFLLLGAIILITQIVGMLVLTGKQHNLDLHSEMKPEMNRNKDTNIDMKDAGRMLRSASFWCYFSWVLFLSSAALIVIGNSTLFAAELDNRTYVVTICAGLISIFNGLGRILSGFLLDRVGSRRTMILLTLGFIISEVLLYIAARTEMTGTLMMSYSFLGLSYGGILPCNSTYIRSIFGNRNFAIHFSIINLSLLIAGFIGPWLASFVISRGGVPVSYLLLIIMFVAGTCLAGVKQHVYKKQKGKIMKYLTQEQLNELKQFDSPTVYNAVDGFHLREATCGFTKPGLVLRVSFEEPMVGYAVTAKVSAMHPNQAAADNLISYYDTLLQIPAPTIAVVQDTDTEPIGSFWGEVQATSHLALGCIGTITQGGVRDLNEAGPLGFYFFSTKIMVARGYTHVDAYDCPVEVCGLTIRPGDLIHADKHGAVIIPHEIAAQVADACRAAQNAELSVLEPCREVLKSGKRPTAAQMGAWRKEMGKKR